MASEALSGDPFDALGDPTRRRVLSILGRGEQSVQDLADELPISRPAVSRHLRVLREAGLVTDRADGTRRIYRLEERGVDAVQTYLDDVWGDATRRFRLFAENTTPRCGEPGS